jgi:hypothetical protein
MGLHAVPARSGRLRPIHNIGLAVALVPVYAAALRLAALPPESLLARFRMGRGLFAYSLVSIFLVAVTVAGLVLLRNGLAHASGDAKLASAVVFVAGISPPIVSHCFLVFPEVAALFVTCLVVWLCLKAESPSDWKWLLVVALALGLLPWAHNKFLLYSPGLAAAVVWKRWPLIRVLSARGRLLAVALLATPPLLLQVWVWTEWGTLGGALTTTGVPFSWEMLKTGLPGLLIDRQSGLLAYAPIYAVVPAAWILTWRRTWPWLVPGVLLYLPAAAFTIGWWAGFSPAARYLVPHVPLLLVVLASALRYGSLRACALVLLVGQAAINAVVWHRPRLLWPVAEGNRALDALGWFGRLYEAFLPTLQSTVSAGDVALPLVAWLALTVLLVSLAGEPAGKDPVSGEAGVDVTSNGSSG